jgi:hypothetical protein
MYNLQNLTQYSRRQTHKETEVNSLWCMSHVHTSFPWLCIRWCFMQCYQPLVDAMHQTICWLNQSYFADRLKTPLCTGWMQTGLEVPVSCAYIRWWRHAQVKVELTATYVCTYMTPMFWHLAGAINQSFKAAAALATTDKTVKETSTGKREQCDRMSSWKYLAKL